MYADCLWRTCKDIQTRLMQTVQIVQTSSMKPRANTYFTRTEHISDQGVLTKPQAGPADGTTVVRSLLCTVFDYWGAVVFQVLCYFVPGGFPHVLSILRWPRGHVFDVKQIRVWTFQFSVFSDLYLSPRFSSCSFADYFCYHLCLSTRLRPLRPFIPFLHDS